MPDHGVWFVWHIKIWMPAAIPRAEQTLVPSTHIPWIEEIGLDSWTFKMVKCWGFQTSTIFWSWMDRFQGGNDVPPQKRFIYNEKKDSLKLFALSHWFHLAWSLHIFAIAQYGKFGICTTVRHALVILSSVIKPQGAKCQDRHLTNLVAGKRRTKSKFHVCLGMPGWFPGRI